MWWSNALLQKTNLLKLSQSSPEKKEEEEVEATVSDDGMKFKQLAHLSTPSESKVY